MMLNARAENARVEAGSLAESSEHAAAAIITWQSNLPSAFKEKRKSFEAQREKLMNKLTLELQKLGATASRDQFAEVLEQFKQQNEEAIAENRSMADDLVAELKSAGVDEVPESIKEFRSLRVALTIQRREDRARYEEQLKALASKEAREELREAFHEEQRQIHNEVKDALKAVRFEIRTHVNQGDRRLSE